MPIEPTSIQRDRMLAANQKGLTLVQFLVVKNPNTIDSSENSTPSTHMRCWIVVTASHNAYPTKTLFIIQRWSAWEIRLKLHFQKGL